MSKVVRLSDTMIIRLEDYRKTRIERAKILSSCCDGYLADVRRYEEMSYPELVEDSIISALVNAETDVVNLKKCYLDD